ncbi:MAG: hypothetical protein Q7S40_14805 [Opitutaceae bacterium]|nr:hypothetical protein [Opitutaceae bacterium]
MPDSAFLAAIVAWLTAEPTIESAVLYGSGANGALETHHADEWSDIDLHVVTSNRRRVYEIDWTRALPTHRLCFCAIQPATGGTNKMTVIFSDGQLDVVIVSKTQMRLARWAMRFGLHRKVRFIRDALNEMATSMRTGYRFLKGAHLSGDIYSRVVNEMPGVRLRDIAVRELADLFLVNMVVAMKRLDRGELVAVQYSLHRQLVETNLRLLREIRLRRGASLPSFGLGRRVEVLLSSIELSSVRVSARLDRNELSDALKSAFAGMKYLTRQLVPDWSVPPAFDDFLMQYSNDKTSRSF